MQNQKTILLIDDDHNDLAITSAFLRTAGYRVLVADDGETGVRRALFAKPDMILLDALMPGVDGYSACQKLKSNHRTSCIPVMLKTCLCDEPSIIRACKAGADDYIVKTGNHYETLVGKVAIWMQQSPLEAAKTRLLDLLNA